MKSCTCFCVPTEHYVLPRSQCHWGPILIHLNHLVIYHNVIEGLYWYISITYSYTTMSLRAYIDTPRSPCHIPQCHWGPILIHLDHLVIYHNVIEGLYWYISITYAYTTMSLRAYIDTPRSPCHIPQWHWGPILIHLDHLVIYHNVIEGLYWYISITLSYTTMTLRVYIDTPWSPSHIPQWHWGSILIHLDHLVIYHNDIEGLYWYISITLSYTTMSLRAYIDTSRSPCHIPQWHWGSILIHLDHLVIYHNVIERLYWCISITLSYTTMTLRVYIDTPWSPSHIPQCHWAPILMHLDHLVIYHNVIERLYWYTSNTLSYTTMSLSAYIDTPRSPCHIPQCHWGPILIHLDHLVIEGLYW